MARGGAVSFHVGEVVLLNTPGWTTHRAEATIERIDRGQLGWVFTVRTLGNMILHLHEPKIWVREIRSRWADCAWSPKVAS